MRKDELLKHLAEAIQSEESASAIYFQHLQALSSRLDFHPDDISKFKKALSYLITQNERHKKIVEELYQEITKDKRNDF